MRGRFSRGLTLCLIIVFSFAAGIALTAAAEDVQKADDTKTVPWTPADLLLASGTGGKGLAYGEVLRFSAGSKGTTHLASGWSGNEPWGTWSR